MKPPLHSPRRGAALLMVLGILVLVCALVLSFFSSVNTELIASQSYANGATVKQLSDSAVQVAISQVVAATQGTANGSALAWASQPGMIRTYGTAGNPAKFYKLYSAPQMVVDGTGFDPAGETPPADWDSAANAGLFTDLNSPVTRNGTVYFPIVDPRAKAVTAAQSVEGFDYQTTIDGAVAPGTNPDLQRLPMPVRWLYVLQNGKLAVPKTASAGKVTFDATDPASVPSASNPIVGRVAFWTDDETCKVNINTASEGTFWDRPWANNTTEQGFSTAIPAQNEFQRYPGHPAKTCLSPVFGSILPSPTLSPAWYDGMGGQASTSQSELKAYYDLVPRIADGGTRGGTVNETTASGGVNAAFSVVTPDADRLYASVDELLYSPARVLSSPLTAPFVEKAKFFLTGHSRAPELNLFGKPRMTLWPIQSDKAKRNVKDKLIAFCSEINQHPYYFQRATTYTPPANPGAGSPGSSSQSATMDWTGVTRNQDLYRYLDTLTQENIPGFGGNFASKYPHSRQQILTEMFDMIRSGVNAYSNGLTPAYSYAPTYGDPGEGQVVPLVPPAGTPGAGTHGFGRFTTVTGAALVFYRSNAATCAVTAAPNNLVPTNPAEITMFNTPGVVVTPAAQIGAVLVLQPFTASPGFPPWSPNLQYVVSGLDKFTINGQAIGFTSPLVDTVTARADFSGTANSSPFFGITANFRYANDVGQGQGGTDASKTAGTANYKQYPFVVQTGVTLPDNHTPFDFNTDSSAGHPLTITIYSGSDASRSTPIQTITMNFPPVTGLPVPTTYPNTPTATGHTWYQYLSRFADGAGSALTKPDRLRMVGYGPIPTPGTSNPYTFTYPALGNLTPGNPLTQPYWVNDVVRGVEAAATAAAKGDYRIYAALPNVPASYFTSCQGYDSPVGGPQLYANVQTLRDEGQDGGSPGGFGYDNNVPGGYYAHYPSTVGGSSNGRGQLLISTFATGTLIPKNLLAKFGGSNGWASNTNDQEYRATVHPAVPSGLNGATLSNGNYGDWDSLTGLMEDGPFINKPDEGNSATVSNTTGKTNLNAYYGGNDISGGYFSWGMGPGDYKADTGTTFSPNRQVASAVMFGSLPTGIDPSGGTAPQPWQTLLFCANPAAISSPGATAPAHPGMGSPASGPPYTTPPDHLFLDLFTMPVVEPYAISEPFSTAGKVNMNYQVLPFTYVHRDTGVRAVLKSSRVMAIPQSVSTTTAGGGASYKDGTRSKFEFRYNINPGTATATPAYSDGTLSGFETRFKNGGIFRSASEICSLYLVPQKIPNLSSGMAYPAEAGTMPTYGDVSIAGWWANFLLTGDNVREFPYGDLYPRLTTKSNTYTVHLRVQTLKKVATSPAAQWVEGTDQVTGEYRGSVLFERYVDAADTSLPDFAATGAPSVDGFYKVRIVSAKKFSP